MKKSKKGQEEPEAFDDNVDLDQAFDEEDLEDLEALDGGEFDFDNDDDR